MAHADCGPTPAAGMPHGRKASRETRRKLLFPLHMPVVALATLVSSGMSSVLARHLGAWNVDAARAIYAGAHGLAAFTGPILIALTLVPGESVALRVAGRSAARTEMGLIRVLVLASPLIFPGRSMPTPCATRSWSCSWRR